MAFERKQLGHTPPNWVQDGEVYLITICLEERGSKRLIEDQVATQIREAVAYYHSKGLWWAQLFLLMPDHLHALVSFNQKQRGMSECVRTWKSYLKRKAGIEWQRGYFDHRFRSANSAREKSTLYT